MLFQSEFKKTPDSLSDYLPWAYLAANGVMFNKDGSLQRSYKFLGRDIDSVTDHELVGITNRLNNGLKRLGSGWALFIESRRIEAKKYPTSKFRSKVATLIDVERADLFNRSGSFNAHFESENYITFVFRTPPESLATARNKMYENITEERTSYEHYLEIFIEETNKIFDLLKEDFSYIKVCTNEETLTYLHQCVSTKNHFVAMPETPMFLDAYLTDQPLSGGIEPKLGKSYLKTITVRFFPPHSYPAMLDALNDLPFEYRWMSRFICLSNDEAEREINKIKRLWFAKRKTLWMLIKEMIMKDEIIMEDNAALRNAEDADSALMESSNQEVSYGRYTATVTVWDEDPQVASTKIKEIEKIINGQGFTTIREEINAVEAWLSSLPGETSANVRLPIISSKNLSNMLPVFGVWAGQRKNKHLNGPPLFYATTRGNTPFRFSNHIGDVGHMMILGPTGSGKSVLLNFLKAQFLRYPNAQVISFDKFESALALTAGVNGQHCDIGKDPDLQFQPLRNIDDSQEKLWAIDWIGDLLINEGIEVTAKHRTIISEAMANLTNLPVSQRTITGLTQLVQDEQTREALSLYCIDGDYGNLLDADHDSLNIHAWHNFELSTLLTMPHVTAPVLSYIFHRVEQKFTGAPTILALDEAWEYLNHPIFVKKIDEWLLTARKNNVSVIFATAGIAKIKDNPITDTLIESCPTRIFLPDPQAHEPSMQNTYYKFGLNDVELDLLANAVPKSEYYYESTLGNRLFNLTLDGASLAFCGSSSKDDRKLIHQILSEKPDDFACEFLIAKGLTDHAKILKNQN